MIVIMRCDEMRAFVWKNTEAHARDLTPLRCDAMRCDAMRCDAMRCDAMRCDAMRCDAMRCDLTLVMRGYDEMGLMG
jgi:pentapeptide MXKDX repeat protein